MKSKSKLSFFFFVMIFISLGLFMSSCKGEEETIENLIIQYADDEGVYQIPVTYGEPYALTTIPQRIGYTFMGLFDSEEGGTQYVTSTGSSCNLYAEKNSLVLFPQYQPKDYNVILDFQGADVVGNRNFTVKYGETLPDLPRNLNREHFDFVGWFTEPNCKGNKVSDAAGLYNAFAVMNEKNFDLVNSEIVYLYAGFTSAKHSVLLYTNENNDPLEYEVEYGTQFSSFVPRIIEDDQMIVSWSKSKNDIGLENIFNGRITSDLILYAAEKKSFIEFDSKSDYEILPIIGDTGDRILLPTPEKYNYKFVGWEDIDGNEVELTSMPEKSLKLYAKWQPIVVLDENGGEELVDISLPEGEPLSLPIPKRNGYIFAGWFTREKELFSLDTMPKHSIELKAGWYVAKTEKISFNGEASSGEHSEELDEDCGPRLDWRSKLDLTKYLNSSPAYINLSLSYKMKTSIDFSLFEAGIFIYQDTTLDEINFICKDTHKIASKDYISFTYSETFYITNNILHLYYYSHNFNSSGKCYYTNIVVEVTYPDTSNLIL